MLITPCLNMEMERRMMCVRGCVCVCKDPRLQLVRLISVILIYTYAGDTYASHQTQDQNGYNAVRSDCSQNSCPEIKKHNINEQLLFNTIVLKDQ